MRAVVLRRPRVGAAYCNRNRFRPGSAPKIHLFPPCCRYVPRLLCGTCYISWQGDNRCEANVTDAVGILETTGFTPAIVALDAMEKAARIRVLQAELNDFLGVVVKIVGPLPAVEVAVRVGREIAEEMGGRPVATVLNRPDSRAMPGITSPPLYNPLIQQDVVIDPSETDPVGDSTVAEATSFALGLIETQGFTAVFEAIDAACKAANVEVVGKEKLGGGYITVVIKGDVAAVKAAVEAGREKVDGLGKLIAAHVIARPSAAVLGLLPNG